MCTQIALPHRITSQCHFEFIFIINRSAHSRETPQQLPKRDLKTLGNGFRSPCHQEAAHGLGPPASGPGSHSSHSSVMDMPTMHVTTTAISRGWPRFITALHKPEF